MATNIRIKVDSKGIGQLLKSPELQADMARRAAAIAAAAGPGYESESTVGFDRAYGRVVTATDDARRDQAENHTLERNLNAGA